MIKLKFTIRWKKELKKEFESGLSSRKRKSSVKNEDTDVVNFEWFSSARAKKFPMPGTPLCKEVQVEKLGKMDFDTFSRLLMSFLNLYIIVMKPVCRDSKDVPEHEVQKMRKYCHLTYERTSRQDILSYVVKSLAKRRIRCHGS